MLKQMMDQNNLQKLKKQHSRATLNDIINCEKDQLSRHINLKTNISNEKPHNTSFSPNLRHRSRLNQTIF